MKGLSRLEINGWNRKFLGPTQLKKFIAVEEP
jgi:hypothetical protein